MKTLVRFVCPILVVSAIGVLMDDAAAFSRPENTGIAHSSDLMAKITTPDGFSQTVIVQGVGCDVNICSRVAVRSQSEASPGLAAFGLHKETSTRLDSLAAIKDVTRTDALFVFKNGSSRRLSIVDGNRFFYFAHAHFGAGKIDVMQVRSIEFLPKVAGSNP